MTDRAFPFNNLERLREVRLKNLPHLDQVMEIIPELYERACTARLTIMPGDETPEQRSWRGFLVGGTAYVCFMDQETHPCEFVDGFSTKRTPHPSCPTRKCSEERILEQIGKMHHFGKTVEWIPALMVVAEFQRDDTSGKQCSTLHPCSRCRRMLVLNDFFRANTLVITAWPPDESGMPKFAEIHTLSELIGYHDHY